MEGVCCRQDLGGEGGEKGGNKKEGGDVEAEETQDDDGGNAFISDDRGFVANVGRGIKDQSEACHLKLEVLARFTRDAALCGEWGASCFVTCCGFSFPRSWI